MAANPRCIDALGPTKASHAHPAHMVATDDHDDDFSRMNTRGILGAHRREPCHDDAIDPMCRPRLRVPAARPTAAAVAALLAGRTPVQAHPAHVVATDSHDDAFGLMNTSRTHPSGAHCREPPQ